MMAPSRGISKPPLAFKRTLQHRAAVLAESMAVIHRVSERHLERSKALVTPFEPWKAAASSFHDRASHRFFCGSAVAAAAKAGAELG
jgi:hypothetical protein